MSLQGHLRRIERGLYYREAQTRRTESERLAGRAAQQALAGALTGQTVFVLGTGPSLRSMDLSVLAGRSSIGVNSFFRHSVLRLWQPQFYCLMDENFFAPGPESERYFDDLRAALPSATFIVTSRVMDSVLERRLLPPERTHFVSVDGDLSDACLDVRSLDALLPCAPNSVMFASLMAVLMGAERIVLLGADHDWLAKPNAEQRRYDPHFYASKEAVAPPTDIDAAWNPFRSYRTTIDYCGNVWRGYEVLRDIALRENAHIINATPGSLLDVFPAADLSEVIEELNRERPLACSAERRAR